MNHLALYAAPYDNNNNEEKSAKTLMDKRRNARNKTLKKRQNTKDNVATMISQIHETSQEDNTSMGDYTPPSPPESVGGMRVSDRQPSNIQPYGETDVPVTIESFSGLESNESEEYYKNIVPSYGQLNNMPSMDNNELMAKLDHILHLLEEQQDEKTSHVIEDLILYSFLGIFIIFIVDSFARAGKYVR